MQGEKHLKTNLNHKTNRLIKDIKQKHSLNSD